MRRIILLAFALPFLLIASEDSFAAQIHGRVVRTACTPGKHGYLSCHSRPCSTMVVVTHVRVDGSVSHRRVATDRRGRFRIGVPANEYFVLAALPREPGTHTE